MPHLWKFFITLLLELVYPTTATEVPATPEIKRMPKLVWLDTGLVNYAAQVQKEVLGAKDIMDAWRGMIGGADCSARTVDTDR